MLNLMILPCQKDNFAPFIIFRNISRFINFFGIIRIQRVLDKGFCRFFGVIIIATAGYGAQVRALLKRYGAAQLSAVKTEDYASLLLAAQAIGNEVGADG